ncbi:MAG: bifunctional oligoribonuclease/PAP phosphatase NrnA [Chloroflexi bacterium]|nr:bifunctional oligoribonuclease/PAP phosphatase NrnA [Chloroflexota bacterium]
MNPDIHAMIASKLNACQKPLILSHIRPDGDAIGSIIGLGLALKNSGKSPQLVLEDGLPAKYRFIQCSEMVASKVKGEFDLVITLDCSDQNRLGEIGKDLEIDINIDHHVTNEEFATLNLIEPDFPATAEILADNLPDWGFELDINIANALLMGILTDTIGFRTSNVRPETLRQSAKLMELGADLGEIYLHSLVTQSFPASLLWGKALSRLVKENGLVWTMITLDDRKEAKYSGRDDADLTNILSSIEGSDMAILFNEQNDGKVKISWRSNAPYNVSWVAQQFGGGGHPPASGAEVEGSLEEVVKKILEFTKQYMKDFHSKGE